MDKRELNNLMVKIQQGDNVAFEFLYQDTYKGVFSFIYSFVRDYHTAEDVLQDTFIKVKTKIQSYIQGTNAIAWILQIAKNTSLDYIRSEKRHPHDELDNTIPATNVDSNENMYLHDLLNNTLQDTDRQIVLLHVEFGYKNREIATILDIPLGTVLWRYNRAIKLLREKLEEV